MKATLVRFSGFFSGVKVCSVKDLVIVKLWHLSFAFLFPAQCSCHTTTTEYLNCRCLYQVSKHQFCSMSVRLVHKWESCTLSNSHLNCIIQRACSYLQLLSLIPARCHTEVSTNFSTAVMVSAGNCIITKWLFPCPVWWVSMKSLNSWHSASLQWSMLFASSHPPSRALCHSCSVSLAGLPLCLALKRMMLLCVVGHFQSSFYCISERNSNDLTWGEKWKLVPKIALKRANAVLSDRVDKHILQHKRTINQ